MTEERDRLERAKAKMDELTLGREYDAAWRVVLSALEAAEAENVALRAERDSADRGVARNAEVAAQMMRARDEARADRDRLREGILSLEHAFHNKGEMWWGVWKTLRALASGEERREPAKPSEPVSRCTHAEGEECPACVECGHGSSKNGMCAFCGEPASAGPTDDQRAVPGHPAFSKSCCRHDERHDEGTCCIHDREPASAGPAEEPGR